MLPSVGTWRAPYGPPRTPHFAHTSNARPSPYHHEGVSEQIGCILRLVHAACKVVEQRRCLTFDETGYVGSTSRHTHATLLLELGEHPKVAQERLVHSTITTTMNIYSHVTLTMQRSAVDRFAQNLKRGLALFLALSTQIVLTWIQNPRSGLFSLRARGGT